MKKINKSLIIFIFLLIIYLMISVSYSYFTAIITGAEDATTISLDSGQLAIDYVGGPNITASGIYPDNAPFAVKTFSVTGTNTVSAKYEKLEYSLTLEITNNTFTSSALSYTLEGSSLNGMHKTKEQTAIDTGANSHLIGNAYFTGEVVNEAHNYTLKVYFLETDENQSIDMEKSFSAHLVVGEYILQVNKPQLTDGMTPIKFNVLNEISTTADDPEWYDYENKLWANAKTDDGSYWVWIPRYAYKIKSCYHMNASQCITDTGKDAGDIEIKFLDGTLNTTFDGDSVSLSPIYSGSAQTNFIKHPAFTFGEDEIKGFWVGKFEPSGTSSNVSVKPNVASLRSMSISEQFTAALNMKNNPKFGWNASQADTHMLKNIEWGAVSYLSQSIYGANEEVYINNSNEYTTGCAGNTVSTSSQAGCANAWNTLAGVKASTTHNITGVYDMSGGAFEYVAAYSDTGDSNIETYGQSLKKSYLAHGTKYVDYYVGAGDIIYKPEYYGDAMYETSSSRSGSDSWYNDDLFITNNDSVFLRRGGYHAGGSRAGLFYFYSRHGDSYSYFSFRVALALLP